MACYLSHTTVNCGNAYDLSEWWKPLLSYTDIPGDPNEPGHPHCMIIDPETSQRLLFIETGDADSADKSGIHFDLRPRSGTRDEEVERVRSLGATEVADHRGTRGPGSGWVTFADPEGNLFCVVRSEQELQNSH